MGFGWGGNITGKKRLEALPGVGVLAAQEQRPELVSLPELCARDAACPVPAPGGLWWPLSLTGVCRAPCRAKGGTRPGTGDDGATTWDHGPSPCVTENATSEVPQGP